MSDRKERLAQYLTRLGEEPGALAWLEDSLETTGPAGPAKQSDPVAIGLEGWRNLLEGREVSESQLDALEAVILPFERPVLSIVDDNFPEPPGPWQDLETHRSQLQRAIRGVGRLELINHPSLSYGGTGFIVGSNLLMTNRHVAELFANGLGDRNLVFYGDRGAAIDLKQEIVPSTPVRLKVRAVRLLHPHWDAAVLEVEGPGPGLEPLADRCLTLSSQPPPVLAGRRVVVIGYPSFDPRGNVEVQRQVFGSVFDRKRLQPGMVIGTRRVRSFGHDVDAMSHDCSTLGGNSGSAVIDVETGQVLGLHFGGIYLDANFAVPMWELLQDPRVRALDLSVAGSMPQRPPPPWLAAWSLVPGAVAPGVVRENATLAAAGPTADPGIASQPPIDPTASGIGPSAPGNGSSSPGNGPSTPGNGSSSPGNGPVHPRPHRVISVPGDWYERTTDAEIASALRRDPEGTRALLRATLGELEAAEAEADLLTPEFEEGVFDPEPNPDLLEIVFIHGIMGGHLSHQGAVPARVWLNPLVILAGDLASRLTLQSDGATDARTGQHLQADGHLRLKYAKPARKWRGAGFVVHPFSFDWRKSIEQAADALHLYLESLRNGRDTNRFAIVAHSMGGLVASLYAQRHPGWSDLVQRAIFMGTPLRGSFAPIEAVIGSYPFFRKLAGVSLDNSLDDMRTAAATLPGMIDMLPDPTLYPDIAAMYSRESWGSGVRPLQRWLDHSHNLKAAIRNSPLLERTTLLVSLGFGTVATLAERADQSLWCGPRTAVGDGTVPGKAAVIDGVPAFKVDRTHDDIPNDPKAIAAVIELITNGRSGLEPVSAAELSDDIVLPEAPAIEATDAALIGVRMRLEAGELRREDVDWLMNPDSSSMPRG